MSTRGSRIFSVHYLEKTAEERGGRSLSKDYTGNKTRYRWECGRGHQWEASYNNVRRGTWCPVCKPRAAGRLRRLQVLARKNGGRLLSRDFVDFQTGYLWECRLGHQWQAKVRNIREGRWCPFCARNRIANPLERLHHTAQEREGRCLSQEYHKNYTRYLWECSEGHQWEAIARSVWEGKWCPVCARIKRRKSI